MNTLVSKTYTASLIDPPPSLADDEIVHLISTDDVDRSREVVVQQGIEWGRFLDSNPIVSFEHSDEDAHAYLLPVGRCASLKLAANGRGTVARTQFDMADEFARRVGGQCKRGFLNAWSVRFRPIEYGPPTAEEIKRRPDWAHAKTIFRRVELVSYSPVLLPDNPAALTIAKALRMSAHDSPALPPPVDAAGPDNATPIAKRIVERDGKYTVESEDGGRTFGTYDSHKQAVERLGQVEYFKHKCFEPGAHVMVHKSMGGGCGTVSKLHTKGRHLDHHGMTMEASHDEPVYGVDMHDDDHDAYGETKHFRPEHMKDFADMDATEAKDFADGDTEPDDDNPAWGGKPQPLGKAMRGESDKSERMDDDEDESRRKAEESKQSTRKEEEDREGQHREADDEVKSDTMDADLYKSLCDCAKSIKHSGEKGHGHWHDEKKAVHWTMADEDDKAKGHHSADEIEKAFKGVDGVKSCKAVKEDRPHGDGWVKFWHGEKAVDQSRVKSMSEGVGAAGGFDAHFENQTDKTISDGQELEPQVDTIRAGHHVKFCTDRFKGVGKVVSVHKGEMVPDVDDDIMGHHDDPGVKIHVHKPHGDGHVPTDPPMHVGAKLSQVEKCARLTRPTKNKSKSADSRDISAPRKPYAHTPLTDEDERRRTLEWMKTPAGQEYVQKTLNDQFRRRRGAVC